MKFETATLVKDIIWFDGPLLSVYKQAGKLFVTLWADKIANDNHWIITETDASTMKEYYAKKITMLDVMRKSPAIYKGINSFIGNATECELVRFEDLDTSILPTSESYYDESITGED